MKNGKFIINNEKIFLSILNEGFSPYNLMKSVFKNGIKNTISDYADVINFENSPEYKLRVEQDKKLNEIKFNLDKILSQKTRLYLDNIELFNVIDFTFNLDHIKITKKGRQYIDWDIFVNNYKQKFINQYLIGLEDATKIYYTKIIKQDSLTIIETRLLYLDANEIESEDDYYNYITKLFKLFNIIRSNFHFISSNINKKYCIEIEQGILRLGQLYNIPISLDSVLEDKTYTFLYDIINKYNGIEQTKESHYNEILTKINITFDNYIINNGYNSVPINSFISKLSDFYVNKGDVRQYDINQFDRGNQPNKKTAILNSYVMNENAQTSFSKVYFDVLLNDVIAHKFTDEIFTPMNINTMELGDYFEIFKKLIETYKLYVNPDFTYTEEDIALYKSQPKHTNVQNLKSVVRNMLVMYKQSYMVDSNKRIKYNVITLKTFEDLGMFVYMFIQTYPAEFYHATQGSYPYDVNKIEITKTVLELFQSESTYYQKTLENVNIIEKIVYQNLEYFYEKLKSKLKIGGARILYEKNSDKLNLLEETKYEETNKNIFISYDVVYENIIAGSPRILAQLKTLNSISDSDEYNKIYLYVYESTEENNFYESSEYNSYVNNKNRTLNYNAQIEDAAYRLFGKIYDYPYASNIIRSNLKYVYETLRKYIKSKFEPANSNNSTYFFGLNGESDRSIFDGLFGIFTTLNLNAIDDFNLNITESGDKFTLAEEQYKNIHKYIVYALYYMLSTNYKNINSELNSRKETNIDLEFQNSNILNYISDLLKEYLNNCFPDENKTILLSNINYDRNINMILSGNKIKQKKQEQTKQITQNVLPVTDEIIDVNMVLNKIDLFNLYTKKMKTAEKESAKELFSSLYDNIFSKFNILIKTFDSDGIEITPEVEILNDEVQQKIKFLNYIIKYLEILWNLYTNGNCGYEDYNLEQQKIIKKTSESNEYMFKYNTILILGKMISIDSTIFRTLIFRTLKDSKYVFSINQYHDLFSIFISAYKNKNNQKFKDIYKKYYTEELLESEEISITDIMNNIKNSK